MTRESEFDSMGFPIQEVKPDAMAAWKEAKGREEKQEIDLEKAKIPVDLRGEEVHQAVKLAGKTPDDLKAESTRVIAFRQANSKKFNTDQIAGVSSRVSRERTIEDRTAIALSRAEDILVVLTTDELPEELVLNEAFLQEKSAILENIKNNLAKSGSKFDLNGLESVINQFTDFLKKYKLIYSTDNRNSETQSKVKNGRLYIHR